MDNIFNIHGKRHCQNAGKREVSTKKNHLISVFNSFEHTISDKKKRYFDKVQSLLTAWEQIVVFVSEAAESPQPEFDTLFLHTLRFVLRADWSRASVATQTHLSVTLQRFASVLSHSKNYPSILQQCRVLESVVRNPWAHPVLSKILADEEVEFNDLMDYFQFENGKVIVVRLEIMLESKCEDIAVRLSKSCLSIYYNSEPLEIDMTQNELDYITDIYFCSLYRTKKKKELTDEIKTYELDEGLQLLQRYNKNGGVGGGFNGVCKDARVWKYSRKVIEFVANTLLANAVIHDDLVTSDTILQDLILEWASMYRPDGEEVFSPVALEMIRKLVLIAGSSKCIYPFCSFLIENCVYKDLYMNHVARCLIRAINQNMNEIEQYRVKGDRDNLKHTYEQLSKGFVLISELFSDYKSIYKECLLTSFSLTPSRESLQKLEAFIESILANPSDVTDPQCPADVNSNKPLAANSQSSPEKTEVGEADGVGKKAEESEPSPVKQSEELIPNLSKPQPLPTVSSIGQESTELNEILESMGVDKNNVPDFDVGITTTKLNDSFSGEMSKGSAPTYCAEVESLNVDESIKTDLNSILRYQRYHRLTWELEWNELRANCEKYLEVFEERGFDEVELKYLDLDYNQFKDRPINDEEYCGIEKGYEQYILSPEESEEDQPRVNQMKASSTDSDSDDQKSRKRKKPQKRFKQKPKIEPIHDESSDFEELLAFVEINAVTPREQPVKESNSKVKIMRRTKRKNSDDSLSGKPKRKTVRPVKPKGAVLSDGNTDSQSENQPPDDIDVPSAEDAPLDGLLSTKSNPTTVKMLREFRINVKPLSTDDNIEKSVKQEEEDLKSHDRTDETKSHIIADDLKPRNGVIETRNHIPGGILKICIPKCDSEILNGALIKSDERKTVKPDADREFRNSPKKVKERKPNDKRPKPRSSATLHFSGRRPSNAGVDKNNAEETVDGSQPVDDFTINCEVRVPKADVNEFFSMPDQKVENDINLDNIENLLDVKTMNLNAINDAINRCDEVGEINDSTEPFDELNNILKSFLNDMSSDEFGKKETKVEPSTPDMNVPNAEPSSVPCSVTSSPNAVLLKSAPGTLNSTVANGQVPVKVKKERKKSRISTSGEPGQEVPKPPRKSKSSGRPVGRPKGSITKKRKADLEGEFKNAVHLYPSSTSMPYYPASYPSQESHQVSRYYQSAQNSSAGYSSMPIPSTANYSLPSHQGANVTSTTSPLMSYLSTSSTITRTPDSNNAQSDFSTRTTYDAPTSTHSNYHSPSSVQSRYQPPSSVQANYSPPSRSNFNSTVKTFPQTYLQPSVRLTDIATLGSLPASASNFSCSSSVSASSTVIYSSTVPPSASTYSTATSSLSNTTSVPYSTTSAYSPASNNAAVSTVTQSTASQNESKLRTALQDEPNENVDLYSPSYSTAKTSTAKEMNLEVVQQILGVYRDTIVRFPELEHVPAPRKRTTTNGAPKRQRRSKKNTQNEEQAATQSTSSSSGNTQSNYTRTVPSQASANRVPSVAHSNQYANGVSDTRCPSSVPVSNVNQYVSQTAIENSQFSVQLVNNVNRSDMPFTHTRQPSNMNTGSHHTSQQSNMNARSQNSSQLLNMNAGSQYQNQVSSASQFTVSQAPNQASQFSQAQSQQQNGSVAARQQSKNYSRSTGPRNRAAGACPQSQAQLCPTSSSSNQKLPTYLTSGASSQSYEFSGAQSLTVSSGYGTNTIQSTNGNGYMQSYLQTQSVCNPMPNKNEMRTSAERNGELYKIREQPPKRIEIVSQTDDSTSRMMEVAPQTNNDSMNHLISLNAEDCVTNNNEYNKILISMDQQSPVTDQSNILVESSDGLKNGAQQGLDNTTLTVLETADNEFKLPLFVRDNNGQSNDPDGVCISIPEDSYSESFLGNYLAFIDGNGTIFEQNDQSTEVQNNNAGFDNEMIMGQLFYPNSTYNGQMPASSYSS